MLTGMPLLASAAGDKTQLVAQVWKAAQLETLSRNMVGNLLASIAQHPNLNTLSDNRRRQLLAHYRQHTRAERFASGLRTALSQASEAQLRALLTLTESRIARRALTEELAFKPVSLALMTEHARKLQLSDEGRARAAAISRLDEAIGVTDMSVSIAATSIYGATAVLRQSTGEKQLTSGDDLARQVAALAERARPWQAQQVRVTYLYLYRNLPLADLKAYVDMQAHAPVKAIQRSFVRSLGAELIAIQRDVIHAFVADLHGQGTRDA